MTDVLPQLTKFLLRFQDDTDAKRFRERWLPEELG
jgi:hypothetical protein